MEDRSGRLEERMLTRPQAEDLITRCKVVLAEVTPQQGGWADFDGRGIDYLCDVYASLERLPPNFQGETFSTLRLLMALAIAPRPRPEEVTGDPRECVYIILRSSHTLGALLGYPYLEHLCRRISPWLDDSGNFVHTERIIAPPELCRGAPKHYIPAAFKKKKQDDSDADPQPVYDLAHALWILQESTTIEGLRQDLRELGTMRVVPLKEDPRACYHLPGAFERAKSGRDPLMHGAATHSFEGHFAAVLSSLIYLHHVLEVASA
jgi:hypothetical protein